MSATKGPWVFEDGSVISDRDGSVICQVHDEDDFPCLAEDNSAEQLTALRAEFAANARLISAAPDLLQELRALTAEAESFISMASAEDHGVTNIRVLRQKIESAKAAIKKATDQ